ncbi:MAG: hypothetical protein WDM78_12695 [Puia sp.]
MEELELNLTSFQYLPVFSREVPENREHLIRTGYVHAVFEEICKRKKNQQHPNEMDSGIYSPSFYLCGWKVMIDEAKKESLIWALTASLFIWNSTGNPERLTPNA